MIALIVLMMATGADRCAIPTLCPSDREIIAALHDEEFGISVAVNKEAKKTSEVVMIQFERILSVSDVYCSDRETEIDTVWCKFTVRYPNHSDYRIAKLTRGDSRWQIVDGQTVTRKRRAIR